MNYKLNKISKDEQESILSMLASQDVLKKECDNSADERWNDV